MQRFSPLVMEYLLSRLCNADRHAKGVQATENHEAAKACTQ
jgi:hypothetical protein